MLIYGLLVFLFIVIVRCIVLLGVIGCGIFFLMCGLCSCGGVGLVSLVCLCVKVRKFLSVDSLCVVEMLDSFLVCCVVRCLCSVVVLSWVRVG